MDMIKAKINMIKQQINTLGNGDISINDTLHEIPRENFTPESMKSLAYADIEIPLAHGEVMLTPRVTAQILKSIKVTKTDNVLEIGTGSGYLTALIASLASTVVTVDIHEVFTTQARHTLKHLGLHNITYCTGDASLGWDLEKQYDIIVINGSMPQIPETIKSQLKQNGRIFCFIGKGNPSEAVLITKDDLNGWNYTSQFETYISPIKESSKINTFSF
jgi:protein-L-isoaspartate(D-aspartate) O-methyltransferase